MVRYNKPEPMGNNENIESNSSPIKKELLNSIEPKTPTMGTLDSTQPVHNTEPPSVFEQQGVGTSISETSSSTNSVNLETEKAQTEIKKTVDPKKQVEQRLGEQGISVKELQKLPKKMLKGIDLTQITRKQFDILQRKANRRILIKRVLLSVISGLIVLGMGLFSYLYLINPPLEDVDEKQTNGYALNEWNVLVNKHLFSGALNENQQSYLDLEYNYASDNETLTKILDIVYENVKYEIPQVARKTIWGKDAVDSEGKVITGVGNYDANTEIKLTVIDWSKINFNPTEVKKAKEELGINPEKNPLPEEDNKTLFEHILLSKLTSNQEISELIETEDKGQSEKTAPETEKEQEQEKGTAETDSEKEKKGKQSKVNQENPENPEQGGSNPKVVGESKSENGLVSLKTILHKPEVVFNEKAGRYFADQKEDIFLDNLLFASTDFNNMVTRFQKALADGNELTTKDWQEWEKLTAEQKKGKEEPVKFERKYSLPKPFIGAYKMQNPDGENNKGILVPKQGKGSKDDPASIETPIDTVQRVVKKTDDGKETIVNHPIRVTMKSFKTEKDALNWFESKDIRNRGLTTVSRMKYFAYEMEVVNLGNEPITITDNTDLVDMNVNSLGRTGSIYGLKDTVTLEPGQKGIIETWGMTTSPQRAFLIWGKNFNREIEPIWFRVLSGGDSGAKSGKQKAVENPVEKPEKEIETVEKPQ